MKYVRASLFDNGGSAKEKKNLKLRLTTEANYGIINAVQRHHPIHIILPFPMRGRLCRFPRREKIFGLKSKSYAV